MLHPGLDSEVQQREDQHPPTVRAEGRALHHWGEGWCAGCEGRYRRHLERDGEEMLHNPGGGKEIPAPLCDRPTGQRYQRDSRRDWRLRRDALQRR